MAGIIVKHLHVDAVQAQPIGDPLDHAAGLVDLVDDAAGPAHVFTVPGRYDDALVNRHRDSAGTWNEPPMKAVMA